MNRREFLEQLFGEEINGWICIRGIHFHPQPNVVTAYHEFANTYEDVEKIIDKMAKEGREVYFVPGAFDQKRRGPNSAIAAYVLYHRSFYLDIDCGPSKPYATKKDGLLALQEFMDATGLPSPLLIDSGNGIHCYWFMDQEVPYNLWKPTAMGLKDKTLALKFKTDQRVVGDGASLLRLPDTFNTKKPENPKAVKVRGTMPPLMSLAQFQHHIPPALTHGEVKATSDELTKSLQGEYPSCSFQILLEKSMTTKKVKAQVKEIVIKDGVEKIEFKDKTLEVCAGCQWIREAYLHQPDADYDEWSAAVTIAAFCEDRDTAIHTISEKDTARYDYDATVKKANDRWGGARTCANLQKIKPDRCIGCYHREQGKINSPISLGRFVPLATPADSIIENVVYKGFTETTVVEAPLAYPFPWARPKQGGIVRRDFDDVAAAEEAGEAMETFIYKNDLWVKELLKDPDAGHCLHMVHIEPSKSGKEVVEFIIPYEEVAKRDALQRALARNGVHGAFTQGGANLLQQYIQAWVAKLEEETDYGMARAHYGWHESSFVVGKREFTPHRVPAFSPPSKATAYTAAAFDPIGELTQWVNLVNQYGVKGNEAKAFVVFLSMGAPLYTFTEQGSCLVHLTNRSSGVGKSTAQRVAASFWGDPKDLMLLKTDTDNARYHMFGVFRHLPIFIDEITNMAPDDLSDMAYRISENRGKHRQNAHTNSIRANHTRWETIVVSSGNNSLYDTLKQHRINLGGEMNRIIELSIDVQDNLTQEEASYWYEQVLPTNHGTAGLIYAQYLADMQESIREQTKDTYVAYVQKFNFKREHRFFRAVCAAAFTGARIAKSLGLHDIDVDRVEAWAIQQLGGITSAVAEAADQNAVELLGVFVNEHKRNEIVVNKGGILVAGGLQMDEMPLREPNGKLVMRMEREAHTLYIDIVTLRSWCGGRRVHYDELVHDLKKLGILVASSQYKRLAEGTSSPGLPVKCIVIDMAKVETMHTNFNG